MIRAGQLRAWDDSFKIKSGLFLVTEVADAQNKTWLVKDRNSEIAVVSGTVIAGHSWPIDTLFPEDRDKVGPGLLPMQVRDLVIWQDAIPGDVILDIDPDSGRRFFLFDTDVGGNHCEYLCKKHGKAHSFEWDNYGDYKPQQEFKVTPIAASKPVYRVGGYATRRASDTTAYRRGHKYEVTKITKDSMFIKCSYGKSYEYRLDTPSFVPYVDEVVPASHGMTSVRDAMNYLVQAENVDKMMREFMKTYPEVVRIHDEIAKTIGDGKMATYNVEKLKKDVAAARAKRLEVVAKIDEDVDARILNAVAEAKRTGKPQHVKRKIENAEAACVTRYDRLIKQLDLLHHDYVCAEELTCDPLELITHAENTDGCTYTVTITTA